MDIQIDAAHRDRRGDEDPNYWKHTDATRQFQQVSYLAQRHAVMEYDQSKARICMFLSACAGQAKAPGDTISLCRRALHAAHDSVHAGRIVLSVELQKGLMHGTPNAKRSAHDLRTGSWPRPSRTRPWTALRRALGR